MSAIASGSTTAVSPISLAPPTVMAPPTGTLAPCTVGEGRGEVQFLLLRDGEKSFASAENEIWCECEYFSCCCDHTLPPTVIMSMPAIPVKKTIS